MQSRELCIRCGLCAECCPKSAITPREDRGYRDYDKTACLEMHEELVKRRVYPCGICTKVAPVGKTGCSTGASGSGRNTGKNGRPSGEPRRP